jgi:glycosyltransferase involved in cell wall biosynthesis
MTKRNPPGRDGPIGYVVKVFPRVSETFVISEMLALESFGDRLCVFPLHHPSAAVNHDTLAKLRAPVFYAEDITPEETETARARRHLRAHFGLDAEETASLLPRKYVRLAAALAARAREMGIVHFHAHFASRSGHVAALAAALVGCSYSITAHAKDIYHEDVDVDVLRWKIRNAAFVATVTEYNLAYLRGLIAETPGDVEKVVRVYNGVDLSRFRTTSLPTGRRALILGVGRLIEKKGFQHLVSACRGLVDRGLDFECEIIGGGELEEALRRQIAEMGLADRVTLKGTLPTEEVARRMQASFLLALPCVVGEDGNVDALPTVIIEAMASARAVVSTRLSGIPEMVVDGETGLLVDPGDTRGMTDAIAGLLQDPARAESMGVVGRRRAETLFDLFVNARMIRDLIRGRSVVGDAA